MTLLNNVAGDDSDESGDDQTWLPHKDQTNNPKRDHGEIAKQPPAKKTKKLVFVESMYFVCVLQNMG